ncbi:MAG: glutamate racemase, partial [Clostridia bacterium]|nr:glutamate racemase [Clostridia bacterium]
MEKVLNPTVCFFDSGIGGLCLLYECVRRLPDVDFTYFSDNANVPYGSLPQDRLIELTDSFFYEISKLNPIAAVVACNTVTARCIDYLRNKYQFEIIGIQPAVKPAAAVGGKCLVLATPSTADSKPLHDLIEKCGLGRTEVVACPDLAQYIENNIKNIDADYIKSILPKIDCSTVVLG